MPAPLRSAGAMLSHTRLHAAIQAGLGKLQRAPGRPSGTPASNALPAEVETLLERVVGPQAYHRDETWRRQVMEHFRYNLARMADIARSAGAQMIFINPASNLRNCAPFKSEHRAGLTEENLARWQEILQRARQAALENRWTDSLALIDQAAAIDDQRAVKFDHIGVIVAEFVSGSVAAHNDVLGHVTSVGPTQTLESNAIGGRGDAV